MHRDSHASAILQIRGKKIERLYNHLKHSSNVLQINTDHSVRPCRSRTQLTLPRVQLASAGNRYVSQLRPLTKTELAFAFHSLFLNETLQPSRELFSLPFQRGKAAPVAKIPSMSPRSIGFPDAVFDPLTTTTLNVNLDHHLLDIFGATWNEWTVPDDRNPVAAGTWVQRC